MSTTEHRQGCTRTYWQTERSSTTGDTIARCLECGAVTVTEAPR